MHTHTYTVHREGQHSW